MDSTRKVKSVLLFHGAPGGVIVTSATLIANTSVPGVLARIVNSLPQKGARDVAETATRTRGYFSELLGRGPS